MSDLTLFWECAGRRSKVSKSEIVDWAAGVSFGAATHDDELRVASMDLATYAVAAATLEAVQTYIEEKIAGVR